MKSYNWGSFAEKDQQGLMPMRCVRQGKPQWSAPMGTAVMKFFQEEDGASSLEYVLLAVLIGGVIIATVMSLGVIVGGSFSNMANLFNAMT